MSERHTRWAAATGAAVVAVYLVSAFVSGRLSVLARRPLLDGFQPPPPYRYVNPPPDAASKDQPDTAALSISLAAPELGAGVFSTKDMQATLVLEPGAFPTGTASPVTLTITPLDSGQFARAPRGMTLVGNVYRFEATSKTGAAIASFANPGHVVLVYPAPVGAVFSSRHTLLMSADGRSWTSVKSNDSVAAQQVSGDVDAPGLFAVGEIGAKAAKKKGVSAGAIVGGVVGGVAAVAGAVQYWRVRQRTARRKAAARARGKKKKRR